jgi:hypothetical protein
MKHSVTYLSSSLVPKYVKYAAVKHEHYLGPALNMLQWNMSFVSDLQQVGGFLRYSGFHHQYNCLPLYS